MPSSRFQNATAAAVLLSSHPCGRTVCVRLHQSFKEAVAYTVQGYQPPIYLSWWMGMCMYGFDGGGAFQSPISSSSDCLLMVGWLVICDLLR